MNNSQIKTSLSEVQFKVLSRAANRTLNNVQGWEGSTVSRKTVIEVVADQIDPLGRPYGKDEEFTAEWPAVNAWIRQNYGNAEFNRVMKSIFDAPRYSF